MKFTHLHCHTQYSLLDGAASIDALTKKTKLLGMDALAITDHGNMFGVPEFFVEAKKQNLKPIAGCEFYIAKDHLDRTDKTRFHQVLLAKNETGYKNLIKLSSFGYTEGFYYRPRIDKNLIRQHREGLIATTCCLAAEIPRTILKKGEAEAKEIFKEWLALFREDYYIELQRHGIEEQDKVNEVLIRWAKEFNVKIIATNDVHYIESADNEAQDILLCLQTGKDFDDPNRMRFKGNQFYLKSPEEMLKLFSDLPEAIDNTSEIVDKCNFDLKFGTVLLPQFHLPKEFSSADNYLKYLTFEGAKLRYGEKLSDTIIQRINFELDVIKKAGYSGYFLIVQDFTRAAREMNVSIGPGRGSAAGSVVAYCTRVTDIDPIEYDLLFERFLNAERISMPDIDMDFDDEGRQKVIDYVVHKYGRESVAQIITFGTMGAKNAIRDVGRVLRVPLPEVNRIAKLIPEFIPIDEKKSGEFKYAYRTVQELVELRKKGPQEIIKMLRLAETLEGSPRHTSVHAAGVIIAPANVVNYIPVYMDTESRTTVTQYDMNWCEKIGLLKMDFLGLKTLNIIRDSVELIKKNHGVEIIPEKIPQNDKKTFELYQRGETIGTFQFESDGMRMHLKNLKPTHIEDLIAMNALYRPGPMQFIPNYIRRKHQQESVDYPHPWLKPILEKTNGIMVYQEQIMEAAQIMADYTLGEADVLRRIMGKKKADELPKEEKKFVERAVAKGVEEKKAKYVFAIMAEFAGYGFNRSHSAGYSVVAYRTAYLKANYPEEYMSVVLTRNLNNIDDVTFFLQECKRMGIAVLGPDINESEYEFSVNKKKQIRFGLGAIKGVGRGAVENIIEARKKDGPFTSVFNLTKRCNLRGVNKKCLEALAYSGAFDSFKNVHRAQYFLATGNDGRSLIEKAIEYGNNMQESQSRAQSSLFGAGIAHFSAAEPPIPSCETWNEIEILNHEKEVIGFYLSGHPLEKYALELKSFSTCTISQLEKFRDKDIKLGGIVTSVAPRMTKQGKPFARFTIEDFEATTEIILFSEDYLKFKHLLETGQLVFIEGRVQTRYGTTDQVELKIREMSLMSSVLERMTKKISLEVDVKKIDSSLLKSLEDICNGNKGNCSLRIEVKDSDYSVNLDANKYFVTPSEKFMDALQKLEGVSYKLLN